MVGSTFAECEFRHRKLIPDFGGLGIMMNFNVVEIPAVKRELISCQMF
jgi:hypothetical protein